MRALELCNLAPLLELTRGRSEILVGLVDGPVALDHPDLAEANVREIPGRLSGSCARAGSDACMHGTFVAGILAARRGSAAPSLCPGCTLLVRPIFDEAGGAGGPEPLAQPEELAAAVVDCVAAGARVINLSVGLRSPTGRGRAELDEALNYAARRGVLVVAAAGNQGTVGGSFITQHRWVIPVVACDARGRPSSGSNLGEGAGRRGLMAPGEEVLSLSAAGGAVAAGGTSVAAPFVTGTIALLWSAFPGAAASEVRAAVTAAGGAARSSVVPPPLDAGAAYRHLSRNQH
jgi:subtilisin family serine protease